MESQLIDQYKNMLLEVSDFIENDDLRRMKFKCDQLIRKRESEKISQGTQLFTALEQREQLGPTNTEFLKELLRTCCSGKTESLRVVERYEHVLGIAQPHLANAQPERVNGIQNVSSGGTQPQIIYVVQGNQQSTEPTGIHQNNNNRQRYEGPDLSKEISFLSTKLGRDWRFFFRALKVNEDDIEGVVCDYRTVRERIHQCLLLWQLQEQQCASRQKLISALRDSSVERNDLASALEELQAAGNYP